MGLPKPILMLTVSLALNEKLLVHVIVYIISAVGVMTTPVALLIALLVLNPLPVQAVACVEVHVRVAVDPGLTRIGPSELFALRSTVGGILRLTSTLLVVGLHKALPEQETEYVVSSVGVRVVVPLTMPFVSKPVPVHADA